MLVFLVCCGDEFGCVLVWDGLWWYVVGVGLECLCDDEKLFLWYDVFICVVGLCDVFLNVV